MKEEHVTITLKYNDIEFLWSTQRLPNNKMKCNTDGAGNTAVHPKLTWDALDANVTIDRESESFVVKMI